MTYLKYCIKESLRLFPPVPVVGRLLSEDKTIDKYTLRKGTWLFCHPYTIHHRPDVWENPEVLPTFSLCISVIVFYSKILCVLGI